MVKGACGYSGGVFCHLIPAQNGQLSDVWSSYIQRLLPDDVYIPDSLVDLKAELQKLVSGHVREVDYTTPVTWMGSPSINSLLYERNPDGSPAALGASYLVDVELSSEESPVSELQRIACFGIVPEISPRSSRFMEGEKQLRDLVHIVPPASGRGLAAWLFSVPRPNPRNPVPPYPAVSGNAHSVITMNRAGIRTGGQSYPPDHRDSPWSLANRLVVVGDGESLEDACLFWNLRANRSLGLLPAWVTTEQAEQPT